MSQSNQQQKGELAQSVRHSFTLTDNETGESWELPTLHGSIGPKVIDIRKLYAQTGAFTYDPGFTSTASCSSEITYIDGEAGILLHRGYAIAELAENTDFMDVCYLLLHGELPSPEEKEQFDGDITRHSMLHEQLVRFYSGFVRSAHPMAIMVGVVGALSAFYHDSTDINDPLQRMSAAHRLISKMPTIGAYAFKYWWFDTLPYGCLLAADGGRSRSVTIGVVHAHALMHPKGNKTLSTKVSYVATERRWRDEIVERFGCCPCTAGRCRGLHRPRRGGAKPEPKRNDLTLRRRPSWTT